MVYEVVKPEEGTNVLRLRSHIATEEEAITEAREVADEFRARGAEVEEYEWEGELNWLVTFPGTDRRFRFFVREG